MEGQMLHILPGRFIELFQATQEILLEPIMQLIKLVAQIILL